MSFGGRRNASALLSIEGARASAVNFCFLDRAPVRRLRRFVEVGGAGA
jgi:hypothetical protein